MRFKSLLFLVLSFVVAGAAPGAAIAGAESTNSSRPGLASGVGGIPSYYSHLDFNLTSPGAYTTAAGGFANPAVYALMPGSELEYFWTDEDNTSLDRINHWGLFLGLKYLGLGVVHNRVPTPGAGGTVSVTDYRAALSGGSDRHTYGAALGWSSGDTDQFDRSTLLQLGTVYRLSKYMSAGLAGTFSTGKDDQSGLADLAVRPLGNHRVTVFGDLELPRNTALKDAPWSAGAVFEPVDGVRLVGRYYDDESFGFSLVYAFGGGTHSGRVRATASPRFDRNGDHAYTNYGVRLGFAERNLVGSYLQKDRYYLNLNLGGPVVHSRYKYLDAGFTLTAVLAALEDARNDPRVKGVAINLSGSRMSFGMAWEIREKLAELQRGGKHVVVFIDELMTTHYYLASVADRVVMDPQGVIILSGYCLGRTYVTNLRDKLGIGFDEWRFLKYKSAVESLSRHSMSDADREQRQALVDGYYDTVKAGVAAARGVSESTFDQWVDDLTLISSTTAMEEGLVDTVGRWEDIKDVIAGLEGSRKSYIGANALAGRFFKPRRWGEPPRIALVYALGGCDMDTGIKARRLEKIFLGLRDDKRVKAVVFRVNSPGGSALASDVVVEALKKCSARKPVIVSQADVAASGGYWISTYADEIVAQPTTITGSIGVIGGWVWDNGMGEKVGLEGDFVKRGEHADLAFGLRLPLIGISVPHRPLTPDERDQILAEMEVFYGGFVKKVAGARNMTEEAVERVAQGRVWTGLEGKKIGLVDRIGGLEAALDVAREKAGFDRDEEVEVVEYGTRGLINFAALNPLPIPDIIRHKFRDPEEFDPGYAGFAGFLDYFNRYELIYLRAIAKNNGKPMCLIPPDYLPRESHNFSE